MDTTKRINKLTSLYAAVKSVQYQETAAHGPLGLFTPRSEKAERLGKLIAAELKTLRASLAAESWVSAGQGT